MAKELVYSTRIIDHVEILVDDDVAEDEIELDYFFPRRSRKPLYTVKLNARELFPQLFADDKT